MKKVIHLLILTGLFLAFLLPQTAQSQVTKAAARQASDPHFTNLEVPDQTELAENDDWLIECVHCQGQFEITGVSLQLDDDGRLHLTYTGDHLHYAWMDGTGWKIQIIDETTQVRGRTSLALDGQGYAHISYFDALNADLKYAFQDESGWNIVTLDYQGNVGSSSCIALDQNGFPHISYTGGESSEEQSLKYAYLNEQGWHITTVDSGGIRTGTGNSLVLDKHGNPHISYLEFHNYSPINSTLKYAFWDDSGWEIENVVDAVQGETSLALDGNGHVHILYPSNYFVMYSALSYIYQDEFGWHDRLIAGGTQYHFNSLVMDEAGYPHLSYVSGMYKTNYGIVYAYSGTHVWHYYGVYCFYHNFESGGDNALVLDADGLPHIVYIDGTGQNLMYAHRASPFPVYSYQFFPLVTKGTSNP